MDWFINLSECNKSISFRREEGGGRGKKISGNNGGETKLERNKVKQPEKCFWWFTVLLTPGARIYSASSRAVMVNFPSHLISRWATGNQWICFTFIMQRMEDGMAMVLKNAMTWSYHKLLHWENSVDIWKVFETWLNNGYILANQHKIDSQKHIIV